MLTKSTNNGQTRLEIEKRRELPFWKTITEAMVCLILGTLLFFIGLYCFPPVWMMGIGIPVVLFWCYGLFCIKVSLEPFKKTFVIDVHATTLSLIMARSRPLRARRHTWLFAELEQLYFTEERRGIPSGLKLRVKGRRQPIDVESLRVGGASKGVDMVTIYKEFASLVPGIGGASDGMLRVYESSLEQWDKGNVRLSDIEVPDATEQEKKP
ncbi:MAG: hypothetical protein Q6373_008605 [Candidatus Sigynarchaeota archaeon]